MKFTPTPKDNKKELEADLQEFLRKLLLLGHFGNTNRQHQTITNNSLVKNKSNFVPPKSDCRELNMVIDNVTQLSELNQAENRKTNTSNIYAEERTALQSLNDDDTIIITEADKGGATVIMNRT